jgi:hypothetical protein
MKPIPSPMSRNALDLMNKAQHLSDRIDVLSKEKCPDCEKTKMGCAKMGCGGKMAKADMATKDKYCMKNFGKKYSECSGNEKAQCDKAHGKPDKDDKMKGDGTFTIGDAQRRNAGMATGEPRDEPDYSEETGYAPPPMLDMNAKPTDKPDMKLDEGPPRQQKRSGMRGSEGRGVKVKRPGFRSSEPMPLSDNSPRVKESQMAKSVEAGSQPGFTTSFDSSPMGVMFMSETGGQTRNAYYTTNQYPYNAEDVTNKGATSVQVSLDKLAAMLNPHEGGGVSRLDDGGVLKNNPN